MSTLRKFQQARKMRRPPVSVLLLLLFAILLLPILHHPFRTTPPRALPPTNTTAVTPTTTRENTSPQCMLITPLTSVWSYNSRSHCVFRELCLTPDRVFLPSEMPICATVTASFHPLQPARPCEAAQFSQVSCAYTPGMLSGRPSCGAPGRLDAPVTEPDFPEHVIVVPYYPFPANIYHFANVRTTLLHHVRHTRQNPSVVLFRGSPNRNAWQASFHRVITSAVQALAPGVSFEYLPQESSFCGKEVTLLGRRGHTNVWPFPNTTLVDPHGGEVPVESLEFRRAFYDAFKIPHALPVDNQQTDRDGVMLIPHPPLVLGYARRLGPGAATGGNVHAIGTMRRFSETDETWFQAMLEEETSRQDVRLHVFTTSADDSLNAQVTNFASLGGVIGIHGANLVNTMFMQPLSLLIEVFPANVFSLCYYAGGNAGLKYIRFESADAASAEESGCESGRCLVLNRQRLVKIGKESERVRLRQSVRDGLSYLTGLRTRFPGGIPVVKDAVRGVYKVVD